MTTTTSCFAIFRVAKTTYHCYVNTLFNKLYHISIKNVYLLKGYTAQKFMKEFPK